MSPSRPEPKPGSTPPRPALPRQARPPHRLPRAVFLVTVLSTALGTRVPTLHAGVVINEVMYHPPNDRDELQWVELHNPDATPADLSGWSFGKGLKFTFPAKTVLPPGGFIVVSRDRVAFRSAYGSDAAVLGDFAGRLSHGGETIELIDAAKRPIDRVKYADADPWPVSPDGLSSSLERIHPATDGTLPENWAPSPLPPARRPAGTPGKPNDAFQTNLPPVIALGPPSPPTPNQPIPISARVTDPDGIQRVTLLWRRLPLSNAQPDTAANRTPENEIPMTGAGDQFTAALPPQPEGTLVRFRIRAIDTTGAERTAPHPHDLRPASSLYVGGQPSDARIPVVSLHAMGPQEAPGQNLQAAFNPGRNRGRNARPGEPSRGESVMLYQPVGADRPQVFDYIRITPRNGGWKVRLNRDRPLDQMTTVNVVFEHQPRFVLSEFLAYELYRAAGCPAPLGGHWRVSYNGRSLGYYLFVEQINGSFLRRNQRDDLGDLYKLLWYGGDIIGQHEKKNRPESGHANLVQTLDALQGSSGTEQWNVIQTRFNVDNFVNYYAVNMCIQNWDGFFNNYFVFRTAGADGKWEIYPWDEDKTWGDYDGASPQYDWYSMPLTFGMNGDRPPRSGLGFGNFGGIHGGPSWWRNPGWFSGPLLANPTFRARFLSRLREICETTFTPENFEPVIAGLEQRLAPEVRYKAAHVARNGLTQANGWTDASEFLSPDAEAAARQFQRHIASYRNQVQHRRDFLLRELDKAGVKRR